MVILSPIKLALAINRQGQFTSGSLWLCLYCPGDAYSKLIGMRDKKAPRVVQNFNGSVV